MLLCGLSRGQACWDTRAVRHNCEVKKTNAICMTEIIAQCQVPPPPTSLSLSLSFSPTLSLSSLPLALLPFCLTFHQLTRSKIRLPTLLVKPDSVRDNHGKRSTQTQLDKCSSSGSGQREIRGPV